MWGGGLCYCGAGDRQTDYSEYVRRVVRKINQLSSIFQTVSFVYEVVYKVNIE